ncbi:phosphate ABC transporter substrate-binding protein PstS [Nocardioides sp.]|uniref:phosphate ABC transporter substrate-binding protein PstS n=1 Tax=Nocardioides sp. TaxID=35761 RepID=UPI003564B255
MNRTSIRRALVPGIAALTLALSSCAAGNEAGGSNGESGSGLSGSIAGGGASSQEKAQAAWRAGFQGENPDATVNYDPVGSGSGRENFISEAYLFAGTDAALSDEEGELAAADKRCGGDVIQIPAYVSPIAVVFNLDGIDSLNLSAPVIAKIFAGKITKWNDPAIAAENDGVDLPNMTITPVHRQDDSGTTENFTKYLEAASDGAWSHEPDGLWPAAIKGGEAADGTSGLVGAVSSGQGTIGYADDSAAGDLGVVAVKVGDEFNTPSAEGAAKVLAVSPRVEGASESNMALELDRATTESGAYPVLLVSYLLACSTYASADDAELVKGYLTYVVSTEGQEAAAGEAGSAPLEASIQEEAMALVESISAK